MLSACAVTPEVDQKLVCQVSDDQGNRHIEFHSYKRKVLYPTVHGPVQVEPGRSVIFRSEHATRTLFPSEDVEAHFLSTQICRDSRFVGQTVYVYPVRSTRMWTPNVIAVSEDGGQRFDLRPLPHNESPPVIVDPEGYLYSVMWYDKQMQFVSERDAWLEQTASLHTQSPYACPQCPPVVWRRMRTTDAGRTWTLAEHKILRPDLMPPKARIALEKVALKVDYQRSFPGNIRIVDWPGAPMN